MVKLRRALANARLDFRDDPLSAALHYGGATAGVLGALLLATYTSVSAFGWIAFLVSNLALIGFTRRKDLYGLFIMQLCFLGTTVMGIARAFT